MIRENRGEQKATQEQWLERRRQRAVDRAALEAAIQDASIPSSEKHHLECEYVFKYGQALFTCPSCWLTPGYCVCGLMRTFAPIPGTRIVVHMHRAEWARGSNTGSIACMTLPGMAEKLMRGYKPHDERLQQVLTDPSTTTAILWPGHDSVLPHELKAIAEERTEGRMTIIAVDATWQAALRLRSACYPRGILQVRLGPDVTLRDNASSLLRPVRKYRGDLSSNGRVSTCEALAMALHELHGEAARPVMEGLLANLRIKVDAVLLQKNMRPVYDSEALEVEQRVRQATAARVDVLSAQRRGADAVADGQAGQQLELMRAIAEAGDGCGSDEDAGRCAPKSAF